MIRLGSYNIHNGHNGVLNYSLRGMYQSNINLGVMQDINITGSGGVRRAQATPQRRGTLILRFTALRGRFQPETRSELCQLPAGNMILVLVHCGMLPVPGKRLLN